jgi:hypothetical protein
VAAVCDVCGGEKAAPPGDTHEKTKPILKLFRRKELIVVADGTKPPAEAQQDIHRQLRLAPAVYHGGDPVHPSRPYLTLAGAALSPARAK